MLRAESVLSSTMRMRREVSRAAGGGGGRRRRRLAEDRQADDELAAVAEALAVRLDAAAVQLHQPVDEGEADAEPAVRAIQRAGGLHEKIEDARQQFRVDAHAVVAHADDDLGRLGADGTLGAERDVAAVAAVFAGVAEEVAKDLLEPGGVGVQKDRLGRACETASS